MSAPLIKIVNVETGEETEREMNAEELAQAEANRVYEEQREANRQAQVAAKAALLERLGITEEEAKLLLS